MDATSINLLSGEISFSMFCSICLCSRTFSAPVSLHPVWHMLRFYWDWAFLLLVFSTLKLIAVSSDERIGFMSLRLLSGSELWMQIFHVVNLLHPLSSRCPSWIMDSRLWCFGVFLNDGKMRPSSSSSPLLSVSSRTFDVELNSKSFL